MARCSTLTTNSVPKPCGKESNNYVTYEIDFLAVLVLAAVVGIVPLALGHSHRRGNHCRILCHVADDAGARRLQKCRWRRCRPLDKSASNAINLTDSRVTPVNVDAGTVWIVLELRRHKSLVLRQSRLGCRRPLLLCSTALLSKLYVDQSFRQRRESDLVRPSGATGRPIPLCLRPGNLCSRPELQLRWQRPTSVLRMRHSRLAA